MTDTAGQFITLVGLMATYKQLKDGRTFGEWLKEQAMPDLSEMIEASSDLQESIGRLLLEDTKEIRSKLAILDDVVRSVASRIEGFSEIVGQVPQEEYLSQQACDFLVALNNSPRGRVLCHIDSLRAMIAFMPVGSGAFTPPDIKFFNDDLDKLRQAGWIKLVEYNKNGSPIYEITRRGASAAARVTK